MTSEAQAGFVRANNRGTHGYDPGAPAMHALFQATGPSFRVSRSLADEALAPAFNNTDLFAGLFYPLYGLDVHSASPHNGTAEGMRVLREHYLW